MAAQNRIRLERIRFGKKNLGLFSPMENDVLNILWKAGEGRRVREVHKVLRKKREVALTSVAVILDRLYDKKIVRRSIKVGRGGEHYIYSCCTDKHNFQASVIDKTVDKLIDNFGLVAVNYFNERFSKKNNKKGVGG